MDVSSGIYNLLEHVLTKIISDDIFKCQQPNIHRFEAVQFNKLPTKKTASFVIHIKTVEGPHISLRVRPNELIYNIKAFILSIEGTPIDEQILIWAQRELKDNGRSLYDYNIKADDSIIELVKSFRRGGYVMYMVDWEYHDPKFDLDFSQMEVDHTPFYRGGHIYRCPIGCIRFGVNVLNKYGPNNAWLGMAGTRVESNQNEWPVAYHGTRVKNINSILRYGFDLDKGERSYYGVGIYCSPNPEAALHYATCFEDYYGIRYRTIIQVRVDPTKLRIVRTGRRHPHDIYWILPNSDAIRPYGVCVYRS